GDFQSEKFYEFDSDTANASAQQVTSLPAAQVSAFGQARNGDIFAVTFDSPNIRKIVSTGGGPEALGVADAFPGRSFSMPVKLLQHPTNAHRWYVVEQGGKVMTFLDTDTATPTVAADVAAVVTLGTDEQGLLGMAFDTDFSRTGEIYLTYTDNPAK